MASLEGTLWLGLGSHQVDLVGTGWAGTLDGQPEPLEPSPSGEVKWSGKEDTKGTVTGPDAGAGKRGRSHLAWLYALNQQRQGDTLRESGGPCAGPCGG